MNNKTEAKRLAFFLYCNILGHNLTRPYVVPRDLEAFFDSTEEVRSYAVMREGGRPWCTVAWGTGGLLCLSVPAGA